VLHAAGRADELNREVTQLETDLLASKWSLDGASWDLTIRDIARWGGGPFDALRNARDSAILPRRSGRNFAKGHSQPSCLIELLTSTECP
jgi:hypothetical protein